MALTLDDLYSSPDHYLHSFENDAALFVPMDRAAYHRSIFLDDRISPAGEGVAPVPLAAFANVPPPQPTSWIFHVAHCGSTLLARALDTLGGNLVLREPLALRQAAVSRNRQAIALAARMASKRYRDDLPTIVKANVPVNFILPDLVTADSGARAIFLYLDLDDYVRAILRSDNHREWLRRVTGLLAADLGPSAPSTDATRAAALWLAQMRAFAVALATLPDGRALNAEMFFAEPGGVLRSAADCLAVDLSDAQIEACVSGPLFNTYAKNPSLAFDNDARLARRAEQEMTLAPEVAEANAWADRAGDRASLAAAISAARLMI
jgi:hypothetical protein